MFRWSVLLGCVLVGCVAAPPSSRAPEPVHVTAAEHGRLIEASVEVLRDLKFQIAWADHRFGRVRTQPRIAAGQFEPWHPNHSDARTRSESTWNLQRRIAEVRLDPDGDGYRMSVFVYLQRRNHPPRTLTESNILRSAGAGTARSDRRTRVTESGVETSFWRPLGRDHAFERSLIQRIVKRAENRRGP
ncbi:MAG: hypothetical protein R3236_03215 [Phycisphaeraceae bacterium]|nr:hypothetical protein [Phycisphaeraceae bacterium]